MPWKLLVQLKVPQVKLQREGLWRGVETVGSWKLLLQLPAWRGLVQAGRVFVGGPAAGVQAVGGRVDWHLPEAGSPAQHAIRACLHLPVNCCSQRRVCRIMKACNMLSRAAVFTAARYAKFPATGHCESRLRELGHHCSGMPQSAAIWSDKARPMANTN